MRVLCLLLLCALSAGAQAGRTLTWDYNIPPKNEPLCSATVTADCVESFLLAWESAPSIFTVAATVSVSICVPRSGGGITCTAPMPAIQGERWKPHKWIVQARAKDGSISGQSNAIVGSLPLSEPENFRVTP